LLCRHSTIGVLPDRAFAWTLLLATLLAVLGAGSPVAFAQQSGELQDETFIGEVRSSGGYGAPTVALTRLNREAAAVVGGQGGWVLNRHFVLGGAVRGVTPRPTVRLQNRAPDDPMSAQLQLGYTGLLFEYIGTPSSLLHYGAELVVGGGVVELVDDQAFRAGVSVSEDRFDRSGAFVSEVGARAELNLTSFFRLGLSGGYRFAAGGSLEKADVSSGDLSAPYGQLSLRFGSF
jgi:hypothetical protein